MGASSAGKDVIHDVGIRQLLLWVWMVVDNSRRHDNHDGSVFLHDAGTHGVDDVRSFFPYVQQSRLGPAVSSQHGRSWISDTLEARLGRKSMKRGEKT